MKLIHLLLLLVSVAAAVPATDGSLTGEWRIHRIAGSNESDQTCTFIQKASELTGACSSANGPVQLNGKIEGKKATWTYKAESQGGPVTVVYKGVLDSETKMSGIVTAIEFAIDGEFTATRSK